MNFCICSWISLRRLACPSSSSSFSSSFLFYPPCIIWKESFFSMRRRHWSFDLSAFGEIKRQVALVLDVPFFWHEKNGRRTPSRYIYCAEGGDGKRGRLAFGMENGSVVISMRVRILYMRQGTALEEIFFLFFSFVFTLFSGWKKGVLQFALKFIKCSD